MQNPVLPHAQPAEAVLAALKSSRSGLDEAEARRRLADVGPNMLPEQPPRTAVMIWFGQFKSPFIFLLMAAAVVSTALGDMSDAVFILGVLCLNATIGTYQEWRAETRSRALRSFIAHDVAVLRNGRTARLPSRDLVPGDIVLMERGFRVPADLRVLEATDLSADESLLTGESVSVAKGVLPEVHADAPLAERATILHAGSTVASGRAVGVVVATAAATALGRIAETMTVMRPAPPPLIRRMEAFTRVIAIAVVGLIVLLGGAEILRGAEPGQIFLLAVALAVAAVPEGLPVAMTVALSISVHRMALRQVIVRRLAAVEGLGSCTLIASDKTGTLTLNSLTVKRLWLPQAGFTDELSPQGRALAESAAVCNEASLGADGSHHDAVGDAVDVAFLALARRQGHDEAELRKAVVAAIPYEPERKYAAAFTSKDGVIIAHVKGALETLLPMCEAVPDGVTEAVYAMAAEGYRVLAVAAGPVEAAGQEGLRALRFLGLAGLIDPVRPEAPEAVRCAKMAGLDVRMITGDHPMTALAIARELGLAESADDAVTGAELAKMSATAFDAAVARAKIFARIEPLQKLSIVQALQRLGHVVAVTGDGVNDAVALKAADIGVAMGRGGTDVAREASDLVLVNDDFASIVAGIEEGRVAYDNLRKVIYLLLSTGAAELFLFCGAVAMALPLPLTAVQLLWLNLVSNGIQDVALAFERGEPGMLSRRPRPPRQPIVDRAMLAETLISGATMGGIAFGYYMWGLENGVTPAVLQSQLLWLMVCLENAHCLNCRSERRSAFAVPLAANPLLIAGILATQGLQIVAVTAPGLSDVLGTQPMSPEDWLVLALMAMGVIAVMEIYKQVARRAGF